MRVLNFDTCSDLQMAAERILPELLFNVLKTNEKSTNCSYLIIDCRSFLSYNSGHISTAHNVHCPPIVKRRAAGSLSLQNILRCEESRTKYKSGQYSNVIVYDERTVDLQDVNSDSIITLVLKGLTDNLYGSIVYFLYGGFEAFSTRYPEYCTSHVSGDIDCLSSKNFQSKSTFVVLPCDVTNTMISSHPKCMSPPASAKEEIAMATSPSQIPEHMHGDTIKYRPSQDQGDPEAILPWLYLGSAFHATQENRLQHLGINALLSLSRFDNHTPSGSFLNRCIGVDDDCMTDIRCWFPEAIDFIESVRLNGGKVLVHCHAGISRSATVCIAYIMWLKHWTMECAYQFLKSKRSLIAPNLNFMRQLVEFENELVENGRTGGCCYSSCCIVCSDTSGDSSLSSSKHASLSTKSSSSSCSAANTTESARSSCSSYASALACLHCDALPVSERPCSLCANVGDLLHPASAGGFVDTPSAFATPSSSRQSIDRRSNASGKQRTLSSASTSSRDLFFSPLCCHYHSHNVASHYSPCQAKSVKSASCIGGTNDWPMDCNSKRCSKSNSSNFTFDFQPPTDSGGQNFYDEPSSNQAGFREGTGIIVHPNFGAMKITAESSQNFSSPLALPRMPPKSAHAKLFSLPLVTTCSQQVFSFDGAICSPSALLQQHANSPTLCHSPLLSPS